MRSLYRFNLDCGRMGELEGLFVADSRLVDKLIGVEVDFGEILGKHSEICCELEKENLTVLATNQLDINILFSITKVKPGRRELSVTICGHNPLKHLEEMEIDFDEDDFDEDYAGLAKLADALGLSPGYCRFESGVPYHIGG